MDCDNYMSKEIQEKKVSEKKDMFKKRKKNKK